LKKFVFIITEIVSPTVKH